MPPIWVGKKLKFRHHYSCVTAALRVAWQPSTSHCPSTPEPSQPARTLSSPRNLIARREALRRSRCVRTERVQEWTVYVVCLPRCCAVHLAGRITIYIFLVEIIQLILNELNDPTNLSLVARRYHQFTEDPYVRASYFLSRYGRIQAFFWALGRGKLMTNEVINVHRSSGFTNFDGSADDMSLLL